MTPEEFAALSPKDQDRIRLMGRAPTGGSKGVKDTRSSFARDDLAPDAPEEDDDGPRRGPRATSTARRNTGAPSFKPTPKVKPKDDFPYKEKPVIDPDLIDQLRRMGSVLSDPTANLDKVKEHLLAAQATIQKDQRELDPEKARLSEFTLKENAVAPLPTYSRGSESELARNDQAASRFAENVANANGANTKGMRLQEAGVGGADADDTIRLASRIEHVAQKGQQKFDATSDRLSLQKEMLPGLERQLAQIEAFLSDEPALQNPKKARAQLGAFRSNAPVQIPTSVPKQTIASPARAGV